MENRHTLNSNFNFDSGPSKKLTGNAGDFIMNIFNLMEMPSTKLALYTVIATISDVNSALQTFNP